MKIISFLIALKLVESQLQLNLIQGQPFQYNMEKWFDTNGYDLSIVQPDLGLQIQGGLTQGPLNTNIDASLIVSTSLLEEYNLIAFLKQIEQLYYIGIVQYNYQGIFGTPENLFNISNVNQVCQDLQILDDMLLVVHCINTSNNQIQIYNYNNSYITTSYFNLNNTNQIISVNIQQYFNLEQYSLYFVYITKMTSFIYETILMNNIYSDPQLIWTYNAQFLQIYISKNQEIFALQFSYLLFQYDTYQINYTRQNNTNWLAMTVQFDYKGDFLIYLVNNYTITELFFLDQFYLIDEQYMPIQIKQAQMLSSYNNIYVLTPQFVLIYGFQDYEYLIFSQFSKNNLINVNNLISSQQNLIVSFTDTGVQIYQLLNYALVSQNPQTSGFLQINYYNINGTVAFNETMYIYLLSSYENQIMPTVYGLYQMQYTPENNYFINFNIGEYFVGSNISYQLNSTGLSGENQFSKFPSNVEAVVACNYSLVTALNQISSYLLLCGQSDEIQVSIYQYLQFEPNVVQQIVLNTSFQINCFAYINLDNQTGIFLAFSYQSIYVYQIQLDLSVEYLYSIDLANIMGITAFTVQNYVVIDNTIFLQLNQTYAILGIYLEYYQVFGFGNQTFNQLSGISYDQNYLFTTKGDILNVFVWYDGGLQFYQQYEPKELNTQINLLFVYPLIDGLFIITVNDTDTQLLYVDKSIMKTVNLGQSLLIPIDTTNFTLNYSNTAYSNVYFYIHVIQNNESYINIYKCSNQQIGALYYSKWISVIPQNITATSDLIIQMDYVCFCVGDTVYKIIQIPHHDSVIQFPDFKLIPQYEYSNSIILKNSYTQVLFTLNISINQQYMYLTNNYLNTTINGNLSNGTLIINPYDYFDGAIQKYDLSCNQCLNFSYQPIIQSSFLQLNAYVQESIYLQQNNSIILYFSNFYWINYTQINTTSSFTNQSLNLSTLVLYSESYVIIEEFLEINTNSISWVVVNDNYLLISSILPNSTQQINTTLLEGTTNVVDVVYSDGFVQVVLDYSYSCFYYQIINSQQVITTIINSTNIQQQGGSIFAALIIEQTANYSIFGSLSQTITNTICSFILNVTQVGNTSFVLNSFNIQYLVQFAYFQQYFPIQNIMQFGNAIQQDGIYIVTLAYTNEVSSGIIQLEIKDYQVLNLQEKCTLQLFTQKLEDLQNLMAVNYNQIAIIQGTNEKSVENIILSLYYVDQTNCNYEQVIQPYSYLVIDNTQLIESIMYITNNSLLVSSKDTTQVYEINEFINVQYNSSQNSSIQITAFNNLFNQSQLINIYYTQAQQTVIAKHQLAWYWILLITLVCLIVVIIVIWYFFYRNKNQDNQYQSYKEENEIEIKLSRKNENITYL